MPQIGDFFSQYQNDLPESVDKQNLTLPDLSGLAIRNPNEYDCKRCGLDHNKSVPGECWNVSAIPYINTLDSWTTSSYSHWKNAMDSAQAEGNYGEGEQLALQVYNFANDALADLAIHEGWIYHMKDNISLDRRCCVSRTGGNNFNNGYVPHINTLKNKLNALKGEMQSYVFQFQGVAPPPSSDAGGGGGAPPPPVPGGNTQYGDPPPVTSGGTSSAEDSQKLAKVLIALGVVTAVAIGFIIYKRRG
jgi:hypothetical protein